MLREDEEIPRGVQERTPGEQVDSSDVVLSEISRSTGIGKYRGGQSKGGLGGTKRAQGSAKGPNAKIRRKSRKKTTKSGNIKMSGGTCGGQESPRERQRVPRRRSGDAKMTP